MSFLTGLVRSRQSYLSNSECENERSVHVINAHVCVRVCEHSAAVTIVTQAHAVSEYT
jgi:hypothetical protein